MSALAAAWGHFWTLAPSVGARFAGPAPAAREWRTDVPAEGRAVRLSGLWNPGSPRRACIVVHGLGGDATRPYCVRAAKVLLRRGWSTLRLELRGADLRGEDFYHAGIVEDLHAALTCETLAEFDRIAVLGYSLGGQLALRYASLDEGIDPRLRAVAAVCAPLDLSRGADHLDRRAPAPYRRHLLARLNRTYAAVAARRAVPTPTERLARVDSMREWDSLTVVPRHGFADVEDYYARASCGHRLDRLRIPSLLVAGAQDPMVAVEDILPSLDRANTRLDLRWTTGGHVGFPPWASLGRRGPRGVENQIVDWLEEQTG